MEEVFLVLVCFRSDFGFCGIFLFGLLCRVGFSVVRGGEGVEGRKCGDS